MAAADVVGRESVGVLEQSRQAAYRGRGGRPVVRDDDGAWLRTGDRERPDRRRWTAFGRAVRQGADLASDQTQARRAIEVDDQVWPRLRRGGPGENRVEGGDKLSEGCDLTDGVPRLVSVEGTRLSGPDPVGNEGVPADRGPLPGRRSAGRGGVEQFAQASGDRWTSTGLEESAERPDRVTLRQGEKVTPAARLAVTRGRHQILQDDGDTGEHGGPRGDGDLDVHRTEVTGAGTP